MSNVKAFYLTKNSKCPKCGGNLKHTVPHEGKVVFDCEDCKQSIDFIDYIRYAVKNMDRNNLMIIFDRCYYEVNKQK